MHCHSSYAVFCKRIKYLWCRPTGVNLRARLTVRETISPSSRTPVWVSCWQNRKNVYGFCRKKFEMVPMGLLVAQGRGFMKMPELKTCDTVPLKSKMVPWYCSFEIKNDNFRIKDDCTIHIAMQNAIFSVAGFRIKISASNMSRSE